MATKFEFGGTTQMDKRTSAAKEFFAAIFDDEEDWPYFVADESRLYDIWVDDEGPLIHRCREYYGVQLPLAHFGLPVGQVIDFLNLNRRNP